MEQVFSWSFALVAPFWVMMILLPNWSVSRRILASPFIVAPAALAYVVLVLPRLSQLLPILARPELEPIASVLGSPEGATIGWIHFLAFDLFVARWIYLDSRNRKLTAWIVSPLLLVVLMLGPLGLSLYFAVTWGQSALHRPGSEAEARPT